MAKSVIPEQTFRRWESSDEMGAQGEPQCVGPIRRARSALCFLRSGRSRHVERLCQVLASGSAGGFGALTIAHRSITRLTFRLRCAMEQLACGTAQWQSSLRLSLAFTRLPRCQADGSLGRAINHGGAKNGWSLGNESFPGALRSFGSSNELPAKQSRQSFRHTLADAIFLTPLALLAVPTFEFFSDVLHWRAHGHARGVTE